MPLEVTMEFQLLVWSVALCCAQMLIAVTGATRQVGLPRLPAIARPRRTMPAGPGGADFLQLV